MSNSFAAQQYCEGWNDALEAVDEKDNPIEDMPRLESM